MRTISELLTILRDNTRLKDGQIQDGLCNESYILKFYNIISAYEYIKLRKYIVSNMPEMYFTTFNGGHIVKVRSLYGWPRREWQPRLE